MVFLVIFFAIILGLGLFLVFRCVFGRAFLKKIKRDSLIIYGKKGHGKTLLFSEMSRMDNKTGYLSTTDFKHHNQKLIGYNDIEVQPNTWECFLKGDIKKIKKKKGFERKPVYLDDTAVYLPNFADSELKKRYPSLPIAYAVYRHLYNAPIFINSQSVERTYKMIREQADGFVNCRRTIRIFGFAFICCTYYDRIESAKLELAPMKKAPLNKFNKATYNEFVALHGTIKDFLIFAPSWRNKYDSRYFHKVFFGKKAPRN